MTTAIQARTRQQIRRSIGYNLLGPRFIVSTFTSGGTTVTCADTSLRGGDGDYVGHWIVLATSGAIVSVTNFDETGGALEGLLTFTPAQGGTTEVGNGDEYEMWPDELPPQYINNLIDQAITDATGIAWDSEEDISLHLHPNTSRYDIPSQFSMINKLELRSGSSDLILDACETVWGTLHANVTGSADTQIKRQGNSSLKLVTGAQDNNDVLAQKTIGTVDISGFTHIEFWVRSTETLLTDVMEIVLSDAGGTEETLLVPAVTSDDTFEYKRVALASPESDTAITTIAIVANHASSVDSKTIWFDDIKVTRADDWVWKRINMRNWYIDQQARDIVFRTRPEYALMKISGGDKPALPSSDTSVMELDDQYIVNWATAWEKMRSAQDGPERSLWSFKLDQSRVGINKKNNVRKVTG